MLIRQQQGMKHVMLHCLAGYNVRCPFLPPNIHVMRDGKPELLLNVVHPRQRGMYFLGFVQAHGTA
jgi:hypothetical protein